MSPVWCAENAEKRKDAQMDNDNKLFPKMKSAVDAIASCCDDNDESLVARSEVYNETWMLRMMLSFIHDYEKHITDQRNIYKELSYIANAVEHKRIGEGGLMPVFNMEGTTWTDAILGNIKLGTKKLVKDKKTKRGVVIGDESSVGVVVIEAKMNSALAPGIKNASDYDQIARNIACTALLVMNHEAIAKKSAFFVFAPRSKIEKWKIGGCDLEDYSDCKKEEFKKGLKEAVLTTITNQFMDRGQLPARMFCGFEKGTDTDKQFRTAIERTVNNSLIISWEDIIQSVTSVDSEADREALKAFYTAIDLIVNNSLIIPWEDIIQSVTSVDSEADREFLKRFYEKTCGEYNIKVDWRSYANL